MEAQAIRESAHVLNRRLSLLLPGWIDNQDVDIIIFPKSVAKKGNPKLRIPNLLASKGAFEMSEDFDDELPEAFWMGDATK